MSQNPIPNFVHLHVHSEYSLATGAIRIPQLVSKVKSWGQTAVAVTDHGNLFGAIEFYSKAKSEGIKSILGSDVYVAGEPETLEVGHSKKDVYPEIGAFHLVLLAKDIGGYQNLLKLVSHGYTDGLREIPICANAKVHELATGLVAIAPSYKSEFGYLIRKLREEQNKTNSKKNAPLILDQSSEIFLAIQTYVQKMRKSFGEDSFYIEIVDNHLPQQKQLLPDLVHVARHLNIPLVATADAHYLEKEFAQSHAVLIGVKSGLTMNQLRNRNQNAKFHLLSPEEFVRTYAKWPDAIANTNKIADMCNVKLELGKFYLPKYTVEPGESLEEAFERIARSKLEERFHDLKVIFKDKFNEDFVKKYRDRLEYEIQMINKMGFAGYFLIVQDFINWAKSQDIPVGPGRGSGAGSLVAYALRITDIDPLRFGLLFERFLNPERVSMPDFDVDFCMDRRDEVIDYVTQKYGKDHVAQITTFGKMMCKAAIRDVGRVLEIGYGRVDRICKLIPNKLPDGSAPTVRKAIELEPRLQEEIAKDDNIRRMVDIAAEIEGLNRQTGVHAAGIVISEGPLTDYVPVYTTEQDGLITQFEMKNAEKAGLVKFDFLGLKTLTTIQKTIQEVHRRKDPKFNIATIPLDDKKVFDEISKAHSVGVFQLEGSGMQNLLVKLKPSTFEDIIAVVALFRPGPLGSGMVDDFIERKHGRQKIDYFLPELELILKETYGVILYQEQVQQIASKLASYSLGEADLLRRAMGKKIKSEMDAQAARFIDGAVKNGVKEELAKELFDLMAKFAEYGFNKSHSAAYGLVSYQTAYLKTHFPEEFMAASMTCDMDDTDKIVRYVDDCKRMKIKVLPPNINRSEINFDVPEDKKVGYALGAIKGIGIESLKPLIEERNRNGIFKNLSDLARRLNLQAFGKKNLEVLTMCGAMDSFGIDRRELFALLPGLIKFSENLFSKKANRQRSLFDDLESEGAEHGGSAEVWDKEPGQIPMDLELLLAERKLCGTFLSKHPLDLYTQDQRKYSKCRLIDLEQHVNKGSIPILVMLFDFQLRRNQEGKPIAYVTFEDQSMSVEAVMVEKNLPKVELELNKPYIAWVGISKRQDGTLSRPRLEKVTSLEEIRSNSVRKMSLNFSSVTGLQNDFINKLKSFCDDPSQRASQQPMVPVQMKFKINNANVDFILPNFLISPNEKKISQIKSYFGPDVIIELE